MACTDCASGHLHEGTPVGHEETLYGLPAYITGPSGSEPSKGIVVIIPDAFGWNLNNSRILADAYAKRAGVTVYLPDFMDGMSTSFFVKSLVIRIRKGKSINPRSRLLTAQNQIRKYSQA